MAVPVCLYLANNLFFYGSYKNRIIDFAAKSACIGYELDYEKLKMDYGTGITGDILDFLDFGSDLAISRLKNGKFDDEILLETIRIENPYPSKIA